MEDDWVKVDSITALNPKIWHFIGSLVHRLSAHMRWGSSFILICVCLYGIMDPKYTVCKTSGNLYGRFYNISVVYSSLVHISYIKYNVVDLTSLDSSNLSRPTTHQSSIGVRSILYICLRQLGMLWPLKV